MFPSDEVHSLEADDDYLYGCEFSAGGGVFDSNAAGVVAWNRADGRAPRPGTSHIAAVEAQTQVLEKSSCAMAAWSTGITSI